MLINRALEAADRLERDGIHAEVVKLNLITPIDVEPIEQSVRKTGALLVAEDCVFAGSVGQRLAAAMAQREVPGRIALINSADAFVTHGKTPLLEQTLGLDPESICTKGKELLSHG